MSKLEQIFDNLTIAQKALIDNLKAQIEILESERFAFVHKGVSYTPQDEDVVSKAWDAGFAMGSQYGDEQGYERGVSDYAQYGIWGKPPEGKKGDDDPDQEVWDYLDKGEDD